MSTTASATTTSTFVVSAWVKDETATYWGLDKTATYTESKVRFRNGEHEATYTNVATGETVVSPTIFLTDLSEDDE